MSNSGNPQVAVSSLPRVVVARIPVIGRSPWTCRAICLSEIFIWIC